MKGLRLHECALYLLEAEKRWELAFQIIITVSQMVILRGVGGGGWGLGGEGEK